MRGLSNSSSGGFIPLTVTATTPAGFVSSDAWTPSLDGLLGFSYMREQLGENFGNNINVRPVEGLPLAVTSWQDLWWYQCGYPEYKTLVQKTKHFHRRFDADDAGRHMTGKRKIETSMGAYKNTRKPRMVHVCAQVSWKAIGDPAEVERLLQGITAIGSGWSRGYGQVTAWKVTEGFEGSLRRSLPVGYAKEQGFSGPLVYHGFRVPGWLPENQTLCVMPYPERKPADKTSELEEFFRIRGEEVPDYFRVQEEPVR